MDKITSTDFVGKWRSEGLGAARFNFCFYSYFFFGTGAGNVRWRFSPYVARCGQCPFITLLIDGNESEDS